MTQIKEEERKLASLVQKGLATIDTSTGDVFESFEIFSWPTENEPLGRIRKKFIPNRRNLGLRGRFNWEIQELESRTGLYQESCLPMSMPYSTN
jgi:hypothetical protein